MIFKKYRDKVSSNVVNWQGWTTNRKIVVIESDDWGSIRISSKVAYDNMLAYGVRMDKCPYNKYDLLENRADLTALFEVLSSVKDSNGAPVKFTANTIMANPDFGKIEASEFQEYHYELFTETYKRIHSANDIPDLIREGQVMGIYHPQFHGREHLNVHAWMRALQNNMEETRYAFGNGLFGINKNISTEKRKSYLPAFDFDSFKETEAHQEIIKEGLNIFEKIFGFRSRSFIAPNYTWYPAIEDTLQENGVSVIQGARAQQLPTDSGIKVRKHKMGSFNKNGQLYLIRNVQFEPTRIPEINWFEKSIRDVTTAFFYNKPAIISTHRLNFMGGMDEHNRTKNLASFKDLLRNLVQKFPSIEFMTSDELGALILSERN